MENAQQHGLQQHNLPWLIAVCGPTASGKTALSLSIARHFETEILSADSRQCFRELQIGVARPTPEELSAVPHHFIASHSITETVDAAVFEAYGLNVLSHVFAQKKVAVLAGGTGLYIRALTEGLDHMPAIAENIRQEVRQMYQQEGLKALQQKIHLLDPAFAEAGEMQNPQRVMRALEVVMQTGNSIRHFQGKAAQPRPFRTLYIAIDWPRAQLHDRIRQRVLHMIEHGLVQEVAALQPMRHLNALQTVGYTEIFDYLDGKTGLEEAVERIITHTRQYAKRQVTWFRRIPGIHWLKPETALAESLRLMETLQNTPVQ